MNKIENSLIELVFEASKELGGQKEKIMIEIPRDTQNGDYSTNIAMQLAKELHTNPFPIAEQIKANIEKLNKDIKVEVARPGFINFYMPKESIANSLLDIIKEGDNYGKNESGKNKKVLVEYVSANPTGDLHLGHAKGAAWGDSMTRILKASGYDVLREYYLNDSGNQVDNLAESLISRYFECFNKSYPLPEDGYHGEDVRKIAIEVAKEEGDKWLNKEEGRHEYFKKLGIRKELDKILNDLKAFRVEFDSFVSEQELRDSGKVEKALQSLIDKGLTYEEDGAIWFKTEQFGDDKNRVLKKSDGSLTYLVPDIANHLYKLERGYKHLVNLWGADHHGYILRLKAALSAFGYNDVLDVDIIQIVRLVENGVEIKMSKRTGNAVTLRELMEDVGVDATRYFFSSRACESHLDFDLGLAKKQDSDNPVYYAQYAHARMCSIIRQASDIEETNKLDSLNSEKEINLIKHLNEFTATVSDAARTRSPNKICNYIQRLAQYFHSFYDSNKVIDKDNMELSKQRLMLVKASKITLKNALDLIGVSSPEIM